MPHPPRIPHSIYKFSDREGSAGGGLAHGRRQRDAGRTQGEAGGGPRGGANQEALAIVLDFSLGQGVEISNDLGPPERASAATRSSSAFLSTSARKLQNTWPRMVPSSLWKIGRVASRCLAVRKVCSTVHDCL